MHGLICSIVPTYAASYRVSVCNHRRRACSRSTAMLECVISSCDCCCMAATVRRLAHRFAVARVCRGRFDSATIASRSCTSTTTTIEGLNNSRSRLCVSFNRAVALGASICAAATTRTMASLSFVEVRYVCVCHCWVAFFFKKKKMKSVATRVDAETSASITSRRENDHEAISAEQLANINDLINNGTTICVAVLTLFHLI